MYIIYSNIHPVSLSCPLPSPIISLPVSNYSLLLLHAICLHVTEGVPLGFFVTAWVGASSRCTLPVLHLWRKSHSPIKHFSVPKSPGRSGASWVPPFPCDRLFIDPILCQSCMETHSCYELRSYPVRSRPNSASLTMFDVFSSCEQSSASR